MSASFPTPIISSVMVMAMSLPTSPKILGDAALIFEPSLKINFFSFDLKSYMSINSTCNPKN